MGWQKLRLDPEPWAGKTTQQTTKLKTLSRGLRQNKSRMANLYCLNEVPLNTLNE